MAQISYEVPSGLPDAATLLSSAQRLMSIPDTEELDAAVQTIFKLVHGVLAAPEDTKKRRVKKSNDAFHRKVGRFVAGLEFLRGCGFLDIEDQPSPGRESQGPVLEMPVAYISRLTDAHHTLARLVSEAGVAVPPLPNSGGFNPFQSNFQNMDSTRSAKVSEEWKAKAEITREEVKKRQREMKEKVDSAPPVPLRPSAFWLSAGRRLEEVVRETSSTAEDQSTDSALLQTHVANARRDIAGSETFQSADKKRLAELQGKRVHEFCILRVICPDKSVVQVHFRAADRGEYVVSQLTPLLSPMVQSADWYLYQSPPLKRLGLRETMASAGFTPGANVYLGFEGTKPCPPYLEAGLVSQMGPAPELERGVNAPAGPSFSGEAMGWGTGQRLGAGDSAGVAAGTQSTTAAGGVA